jgi:dihydrofolate reductase
MPTLSMFNSISLDGYFTGANNDLTWAHANGDDPEWRDYVGGNASGDGVLLFGRVTYQMMESFWPTPAAAAQMPEVAKGMNEKQKVVFSGTLKSVSWQNTRLVNGDPVAEVRRMKQATGPDMVILGSGTIVAQLAKAGLIDAYQFVVTPIVLGAGRTLFEGLGDRLRMKRTKTREFANGNIVSSYVPIV